MLFRSMNEQGAVAYLEHWYQWLLQREQRGARSPHLNWFIALYASLTGRIDEAFTYLAEAWTQTLLVPDLIYFSPLRGDPRWQQMLEAEGLADSDIQALETAAEQFRVEYGYSEPI